MNMFRIKIDLSNFFGDERKLAYILVDPSWDSVSCLQKRVEEIFDLKDLWFVTAEGCFIPPQESVHVVKSDDVLKAFIPPDSQTKKPKKIKRARSRDKLSEEKNISPDPEILGPRLKTRKHNTHDAIFTSSTPNDAKPRKNIIGKNSTVVNEITSTNEQLGLVKHEQQQQQPIIKPFCNLDTRDKPIDFCNEDIQGESTESSSVISGKVKKRKRKRNVKKALVLAQKEEDLVENVVCAATLETDTNHQIAFSTEKVTTTTEGKCIGNENLTKVTFNCFLTEPELENPRYFSLKNNIKFTPNNITAAEETETNFTTNKEPEKEISAQLNNSERVTKSPIIIQENIVLTPPVKKLEESNASETEKSIPQTKCAMDDSSVIAIESECDDSQDENNSEMDNKEISEVIDLNASDDDSQHGKNVTNTSKNSNCKSQITNGELSTAKMLPFSIHLEHLPRSRDIVIFKLYRTDKRISGYIAGKCEYVNSRTKVIKLKIIDGLHEIEGIANRYLCSRDDSTISKEQFLQVKLFEMIEPKLFSEN